MVCLELFFILFFFLIRRSSEASPVVLTIFLFASCDVLFSLLLGLVLLLFSFITAHVLQMKANGRHGNIESQLRHIGTAQGSCTAEIHGNTAACITIFASFTAIDLGVNVCRGMGQMCIKIPHAGRGPTRAV